MRKIIEATCTVVAVLIAAVFIWLVLPAPGFTVDKASTRRSIRNSAMLLFPSVREEREMGLLPLSLGERR